MAKSGNKNRKIDRGPSGAAAPGRALRITPERIPGRTADKATHYIDSGLGGVFRVEVLSREGDRALVRIHMPGTEWHHWQGEFWRPDTDLIEMPKASR